MSLPEIHTRTLSNGFSVLVAPRHDLPVVGTFLGYRVGSRDERRGETGVAHFLEHMMFKGTARYAKGEIDLLTAKMGGFNNAWTDNDMTAYHFGLAADRWETALEIEASRMRDCLLDPEEFAAEKQVVLEELLMGEDDPWSRLWHATQALAFVVHPYHHPVIGWKEDLERLDVAGMRDFYDRHYRPANAFLVVAGDVSADRVGDRVEALFGGLASTPAGRVDVLAEPAQVGARRATIRSPGAVSRVAMACHTCRHGDDDDFRLDVLSQLLGGGKSSRLYRRLVVERQLATTVTVFSEPRLDPGLFWIAAELHPGADRVAVEAIVQEEFADLAARGPSAAELSRARAQLASSFVFERETAHGLAQQIGRWEGTAVGGHAQLGEVEARYAATDRAALRTLVRERMQPWQFSTVWSLPESEVRASAVVAAKPKAAREPTTKKKASTKKVAARKVVEKAAAKRKKAVKKTAAKKKPAKKKAVKKKAAKGQVARKKPGRKRSGKRGAR